MNAYQHAVERLRAWLDTNFDAAGSCVIEAAVMRVGLCHDRVCPGGP